MNSEAAAIDFYHEKCYNNIDFYHEKRYNNYVVRNSDCKYYVKGVVSIMLRKKLSTIVCAVLLAITCIGLVACGNNDGEETLKPLHDNSKWFTEEELSAKGLTGLPVPTGLSGEIKSSDAWYNDGYSFSQICPDEATFNENAETYFSYFKTHYDGMFGKPRSEKYSMSTNENWYIIEQKSALSDYFNDNPSKLYKFYYIRDNTLYNGYFTKGSVWFFEMRYEFDTDAGGYKFKLFIENADSNHNGMYMNYYKKR